MKRSQILYTIFSIVFLISSCSINDIENGENDVDTQTANKTMQSLPVRSSNELIVSFKPGTSDGLKKSLRKKYLVKSFEKCNCTNNRIELWIFDGNTNIEERLGDISQDTDIEGVDFQYNIPNQNQNSIPAITPTANPNLNNYVNPSQNTINIAILDTGINLNILRENSAFLYRNDPATICQEGRAVEISGWDFVNHDNDPFDELGHGTAVTDRVIQQLNRMRNPNYSILPVKVFDQHGRGNTFDILCGYLFAVEKGDIDIINMSFGWYGAPSNLLNFFVNENSHILHVASAGNSNYNNDMHEHYPSSIPHDNVLSIGSYTVNRKYGYSIILKSNFSNYGVSTVDYLSKGDHIFFEDKYNNSFPISGTSYAAPVVTGKLATYLHFISTSNSLTDVLEYLYNDAQLVRNPLPVLYSDRIIR